MNDSTLRIMRRMAEQGDPMTTMSAMDMAFTIHNLDRTGMKATTSDGRLWVWWTSGELWVLADRIGR